MKIVFVATVLLSVLFVGVFIPKNLEARDSGKQVEFGEYVSPGGKVFHGYVGVWMGSKNDPGFYIEEDGQLVLIYTQRGGWVNGYVPRN